MYDVLVGGFVLGMMGVILGSFRDHPARTSFWLGALLGPIGWAVVLLTAPRRPRRLAGAEPDRAVLPPAPAGWLADPSGRHQLRWWNGRRWTAHVMDDGDTRLDPLP